MVTVAEDIQLDIKHFFFLTTIVVVIHEFELDIPLTTELGHLFECV